MKVDKEFTYQVIGELREVAKGKPKNDYDRTLMMGAANVMEKNIRAYLDIAPQPAVEADAEATSTCCVCGRIIGEGCDGLCVY